eukprot:COSAG06_NODE_4354_length_4336_cov_1.697191_2_plen_61_part_00
MHRLQLICVMLIPTMVARHALELDDHSSSVSRPCAQQQPPQQRKSTIEWTGLTLVGGTAN